MVGVDILRCSSLSNRITREGLKRHKGQTSKPITKLSLVFHISCFMFRVSSSFWNMKPNNGGGWGKCSSSFLLALPCTNITTTTTRGTQPMHKRVKRSNKQGEGRKGCSLLIWKERRRNPMMVGLALFATPFCTTQHKKEHICTQEGAKDKELSQQWKNKNKDHLIGKGKCSSLFFLAQTQHHKREHG